MTNESLLPPRETPKTLPELGCTIIVVDDEPAVRTSVVKDVATLYGDLLEVESAASVSEALSLVAELKSQGTLVPLIISDFAMPDATGLDLFRQLRVEQGIKDSRHLLLSGQVEHETISAGLAAELVDGYLVKPYRLDRLREEVKRLVSQFFIRFHREHITQNPKLVSHDAYMQVLQETEQERRQLTHQFGRIKAYALAKHDTSDDEVFGALGQAIYRWVNLNNRQDLIKRYETGDVILKEQELNNSLWFILEGEVVQEKQGQWGPVLLSRDSRGNIFGLLSFMSHHRSFSSILAKAPCLIARFDREILEVIISEETEFMPLFLNTVLRILKRRLLAVSETKVELQNTLQSLQQAQVQLIEAEKMATIGLMTAGVAHELNNPSAALERGADHVQHALEELTEIGLNLGKNQANKLASLVKGGQFILAKAPLAKPCSTMELRQKALTYGQTLPRALARKRAEMELGLPEPLSQAGLPTGWESSPEALDFLHHFFEISTFLTNIKSCSSRIAHLVHGMKNYARAETTAFQGVDIGMGIEDTFWVLQNRLKFFQFEKQYLTDKKAWGVPAQLNQVWTNLINNACDASPSGSVIKVVVEDGPNSESTEGPAYVKITVSDQGSGIPPELQDKIFEPRFTTKKGEEGHYGLGLGLAIVHKIVHDHRGSITFVSRPGEGTTFTVLIPVAATNDQPLKGNSPAV